MQWNEDPETKGLALNFTVIRHSWCHDQINQGRDLGRIATMMGHRDLRMVRRIYGHIEDSESMVDFAANSDISLFADDNPYNESEPTQAGFTAEDAAAMQALLRKFEQSQSLSP